jgi:hypothetical protein
VKNLKLLILAIGLTLPVAAMITGVHKNKKRKVSRKCMLILSLSTSKQCENSADWALLQLVLKPVADLRICCYSLKLNTTEFLDKVKIHKLSEKINGKGLTCDVSPPQQV